MRTLIENFITQGMIINCSSNSTPQYFKVLLFTFGILIAFNFDVQAKQQKPPTPEINFHKTLNEIRKNYYNTDYEATVNKLDELQSGLKPENHAKIIEVYKLKTTVAMHYSQTFDGITFAQNGLKHLREYKNTEAKAYFNYAIAIFYSSIQNFKTGKDFFEVAINLTQELENATYEAIVRQGLFDLYYDQDSLQLAEKEIQQALYLLGYKPTSSKFPPETETQIASCLRRAGVIYFELERPVDVESYFKISMDIFSNNSSQMLNLIETQAFYARYLVSKNELDQALSLCHEASKNAEKFNNKNAITKVQYSYYLVYEGLNDFENAYGYLQKYTDTKKELTSQQDKIKVLRREFNEEEARHIAKVKIENERSKHDIKIKHLENRNFQFILAAVLVTILAAISRYFILKQRRRRQQLIGEINTLKDKLLSNIVLSQSKEKELPPVLAREQLDAHLGKKLNESDWKVISVLFKNPLISIKDLADEVDLSPDGAKSALRKLYKLFNIQVTKNKKMELVLEITKISSTQLS